MLAFFLSPIGRWLVIFALVAAVCLGGYYKVKSIGWNERDAIAQAEAKAAEESALRLMALRQKITERVVVKYRTQIETVEKEGQEVIRVIEKIVPSDACPIDGSFRVLHDAAASGQLPKAPGGIDATGAAPVPVAVAAETVAANYQICRLNALQLGALQEWAAAQHKGE